MSRDIEDDLHDFSDPILRASPTWKNLSVTAVDYLFQPFRVLIGSKWKVWQVDTLLNSLPSILRETPMITYYSINKWLICHVKILTLRCSKQKNICKGGILAVAAGNLQDPVWTLASQQVLIITQHTVTGLILLQ